MSKTDLFALLDETRAQHQTIAEATPPTTVVHPDSGWRVQDLIAHITYWEEQAVLTIEYALRDERYFLPEFRELGIDGFNHKDYERHKADAPEAVFGAWSTVRQRLKDLLDMIPDDQWESRIKWFGDVTTAEDIVKRTIMHENLHIQQIETVQAL